MTYLLGELNLRTVLLTELEAPTYCAHYFANPNATFTTPPSYQAHFPTQLTNIWLRFSTVLSRF